MADTTVLLTNDDGIDSPGFGALCEALSAVADVTAVAPAEDQSAVGRSISLSGGIPVEDHELGYAVEGTPADCVIAGLEELVPETDVVVSGCNKGANLGAYVLGRSGTVSAAVEAAFLGVPAVAASLYIPIEADITFHEFETTTDDYAEAARATRFLVERALDAGVFDHADYLNVNAPIPGDVPAPMEITRPSHVYEHDAVHEDGHVTLVDRLWEQMARGGVPDPEGTDRRAIVEGRVSVSPLTAPHTTEHHEALDELARTYPS